MSLQYVIMFFYKGGEGIFITFEGGEGAGKTTQIELLAKYIEKLGKPVCITRDPGGTAISEKIRGLLKCESSSGLFQETELLLFLAARSQMVREIIVPSLNQGSIVICDRFTDSTLAYQGGIESPLLRQMCDFAADGLVPDLTFFLEIEPEAGLARKLEQSHHDRMELKGTEFHKKVFERYRLEAALHPKRVVTIDATLPVDEIHAQIRRKIYG